MKQGIIRILENVALLFAYSGMFMVCWNKTLPLLFQGVKSIELIQSTWILLGAVVIAAALKPFPRGNSESK